MNENKKQAIVDKLTYIITHTSDLASFSIALPPKYGMGTGSSPIRLIGDAAKQYEAVCEMMQNEVVWRDKFSKRYTEEIVNQVLSNLHRDSNTDKASEYLDDVIANLDNYTLEHNVYLPVDGIAMLVDELKLGKLLLKNMSGETLIHFEQKVVAGIMQRSPQRGNEQLLAAWRRDALSIIRNKAVAIYTTVAESTRIQERAEEEWYQVVHILRYFIFLAYQKNWHIGFGLRGDVRYGVGQAIVIPSTYETFSKHETLKSPQPFVITQEIVTAMKQLGVFALTDMLDPQYATAFSNTLLTGIRWVANALIQDEPANEFLSLVSCLETFLTREKTDIGSIKNAIAGGVSWVLGSSLEERLNLQREMKFIYDKRSMISHGGKQIEIAKLLPRLRFIVGAFILTMVLRREEFKNEGKKALHDWIDEGPLRPAVTNQQ